MRRPAARARGGGHLPRPPSACGFATPPPPCFGFWMLSATFPEHSVYSSANVDLLLQFFFVRGWGALALWPCPPCTPHHRRVCPRARESLHPSSSMKRTPSLPAALPLPLHSKQCTTNHFCVCCARLGPLLLALTSSPTVRKPVVCLSQVKTTQSNATPSQERRAAAGATRWQAAGAAVPGRASALVANRLRLTACSQSSAKSRAASSCLHGAPARWHAGVSASPL